MGKALYRKYRSKSLTEIIGQEHITTTLANALQQGKVSHAYLFTGPRGVGKTSVARILAHEVNGLPYDEEATHLDIIEIDAASNRRIDEIRELREKVHTAPTGGKYKIYIIDEVHMLTREAFNALLKTLEEPPAHAIFILATTEAHKVPETIASRTQRFTFRPISVEQQVAHLRTIAKQEKLQTDDEALELIARHSGGSFRDSISLLDQASSSGEKVSLKTVQNILGIAPEEAIEQLARLALEGSATQMLDYLTAIRQQGYQAAQLADQLSARLRYQLVHTDSIPEQSKLVSLLYKLLHVSASHDPVSLLELTLLEAAFLSAPLPDSSPMTEPHNKKAEPKAEDKTKKTIAEQTPEQTIKTDDAVLDKQEKTAMEHPLASIGAFDSKAWQEVLHALKSQYTTLYGIARIAAPTFANNEITLSFSFPFHQKRFNEPKTRQLISDIIYQQTGKKVTITCVLAKSPASQTASNTVTETDTKDVLASISNIFGDAEVLE